MKKSTLIVIVSILIIPFSLSSFKGLSENINNEKKLAEDPYDEGYVEGWEDGAEDVLKVKVSWTKNQGINYGPYNQGFKTYKDGYKIGFKDGTKYGLKYKK